MIRNFGRKPGCDPGSEKPGDFEEERKKFLFSPYRTIPKLLHSRYTKNRMEAIDIDCPTKYAKKISFSSIFLCVDPNLK